MMCLYVITSFFLPCMYRRSHSWTRKMIGYTGSILPFSYIGVDPMVYGTYPYVRRRKNTPKVPNNKPLDNGRHTCQEIKYFFFFLFILVFFFFIILFESKRNYLVFYFNVCCCYKNVMNISFLLLVLLGYIMVGHKIFHVKF